MYILTVYFPGSIGSPHKVYPPHVTATISKFVLLVLGCAVQPHECWMCVL